MARIMRAQTKQVSEANVQAGDCRFSSEGACRLVANGVGSDMVLTAHAPGVGMSAMLRFEFPDSKANPVQAKDNPWCYADTGVALLISTLRKCGANPQDIEVQAVGGADQREGEEAESFGRSNELAVRKALWRQGVLLKSADLGGEGQRSVWFDPASNRLLVRSHRAGAGRATQKPAEMAAIEHLAS